VGITLGSILAAFGGGVFGAILGPLSSFAFCGFLVLAGEALALATGSGAITAAVAFGPMFGPHIAFSGGAAATAYAAKTGRINDGANILKPLHAGDIDKNWDLMLVAGSFGILGLVVNQFLGSIGTPTDTIALTVLISALTHRILFGNGPFGKYDPEMADSFWSTNKDIAWLPWMRNLSQLVPVGLAVGFISGYITLQTGSLFLMFGISGASIIILQTMGEGPVTHHITFPAAAAAMATGSVIWAGVFGLLGALFGEFYARLFYNWGDTHIDPPACAIFTVITIAMFTIGFSF